MFHWYNSIKVYHAAGNDYVSHTPKVCVDG